MADTTTPGIPTSTELLDLLEAYTDAFTEASRASSRRDSLHLDPSTHRYREANALAMDAHQAAGVAAERLRSAIARSRSALDHVHACEQPSNADLVRESMRLREDLRRVISERDELRERVEVLGGNAEPVSLEHPGQWALGDRIDWDGSVWTRHEQRTWTGRSGVVQLGDTSIDHLIRTGEARITHLVPRPADVAEAV